MERVEEILKQAIELDASDIFLRPGGPVYIRKYKDIMPLPNSKILNVDDVNFLLQQMCSQEMYNSFKEKRDIDLTIYIKDIGRFRISFFYQRNHPAAVLRYIKEVPNSLELLNLPVEPLEKLCTQQNGIIMLTGTTGSGKSTTIAAMLQYINRHYKKHILTLEDPIEFIFKDEQSLFNQRQIGTDTPDYKIALRQATLQNPDIIYVANVRDVETMSAVLSAAETGVLVFGTLHTNNAVQSIERMVSFFPPYQADDIRRRLALSIRGIISLKLIKRKDGTGLIPAYEILINTPTISSLLNENEIHQIPHYIEDGEIYGMCSFKQSLAKLVRQGFISKSTALVHAESKDELLMALADVPDDEEESNKSDKSIFNTENGNIQKPIIDGEYEL